jgi:hypothetical protein
MKNVEHYKRRRKIMMLMWKRGEFPYQMRVMISKKLITEEQRDNFMRMLMSDDNEVSRLAIIQLRSLQAQMQIENIRKSL